MRSVAIMSGGDWADASCDHLKVPDDMNLSEQKKAWDVWYEGYTKELRAGNRPDFMTFTEFLIKNGAIEDLAIEEFYED